MAEIKNYTDLKVYQEGYELTLEMYKITKKYPKEEQYELVSQINQCYDILSLVVHIHLFFD